MFNWKNKKVLITGGNGFLGSHITKKLIQKGAKPFVLIYDLNRGSIFDRENLSEKCYIINGDIRNLRLMESIMTKNNIEIVIHLAAQAIVDQAVDDPLETFEINIQGTWNVLESASKVKSIKKIIIASSDKAYGSHEKLPYIEDITQLKGVYPYEVSKTCADLISHCYHKTFKSPVCITRATNLYGPGDLKFNRIVPRTIQKLFYDERPIIRDTGESLRDYLYVGDAADAYIALAETMSPKMFGHAFNFSTNRPLSVENVIKIISSEMGKNIKPKIIKTAGFEIEHQYAAYDKVKKFIGWTPSTSFEDGIKETVIWYSNYLKSLSFTDGAIKHFDEFKESKKILQG